MWMCGLLWWPGGGRPELGPSLVSSLEEVASEVVVEEASGVEVVDTFLLVESIFEGAEVVLEEMEEVLVAEVRGEEVAKVKEEVVVEVKGGGSNLEVVEAQVRGLQELVIVGKGVEDKEDEIPPLSLCLGPTWQ